MTKQAQNTQDASTNQLPEISESMIERTSKEYGFTFDGIRLVKGQLPIGIEYQGAYHHQFEMRLPTVLDELELQSIDLNPLLFNVGKVAKCITRLGDIPLDAIDADFIGVILPDDYSALFWAQEALLKKRKDASKK